MSFSDAKVSNLELDYSKALPLIVPEYSLRLQDEHSQLLALNRSIFERGENLLNSDIWTTKR